MRGLSLVELLIVLVIMSITIGVIYQSIDYYNKSRESESSIIETQETGQLILELLSRDIMMAGYGVDKKLALFIKDGGDSASDELFINDWTFIDDNHLFKYSWWGQSENKVINESTTLKIDFLDINNDGHLEYKDGVSQYLISDTLEPDYKVAKILTIDTNYNEIEVDSPVKGENIVPAIHYKIKNYNTLCKSARDTGGCQPLAENIVDFQIAYRDRDGNWYCDSAGSTCPMNPFDPEKIDLLRVTIVIRTDKKTKISKNPWPIENHINYNYDPKYTYRKYSIEVAPRNLIYNR